MRFRFCFLFFVFVLSYHGSFAQKKGEKLSVADTSKPYVFQPNPKKSALYSAILPGSGQFYNRQYWKVPVVYVGLGAAVGFLISNTNGYREYRKIYVNRLSGIRTDKYTAQYTDDNIKTLQDYYKSNLDMTYLLTGVGYMVQILDALVFAHLKNFDVSEDISFYFKPVVLPNGVVAAGLAVNFK